MFEQGFLGTSALLYMDVATLLFALLPFLLLLSIRYAILKQYRKHFISQIVILFLTLVVVVVFEIGVRVSGGFMEFSKESSLPFSFLATFLIVHILIAIAAVCGWVYLIVVSYLGYSREGINATVFQHHKKMGKWIFAALTLTSIMGCCIYIFLFIM